MCTDFSVEDNINCHSGHEELETTPRAKKIRKNSTPWNVNGIKWHKVLAKLSGFKANGNFPVNLE